MAQEFESEGVATDVLNLLISSTFGLAALKILIDDIEDKLDNSTFGLEEIKNEIIIIDGLVDDIIADIGVFPTANYADLAAFVEDVRTRIINIQTDIDNTEILLKFPSAESFNDIAAIGPTNTTAMNIVVVIPAGATIRRAMLAAFITVMNDTATLQKIDVDVQGRVPLGAWNTYFSQNDCIGVPNVDAATTGFVPVQDVSAMVNAAGTYEFRCAVTQTAANSVHYTINYVLIITYRMS